MVPKVAGKGRSFKGAGLYYLHDKKSSTAERVEFTLTHNLPTDDPALAMRFMAYTAMRQDELKAMSGQARTGRKLTQAVYAYSLAWAPDEKPEKMQMVEAAQETLKVLGIEEHEAVFVIHNDEPHPHIHVIVNRVHPRTGLAAKLSKDYLKLSKWAEAYEREQQNIRCKQRVENNARRGQGQWVRDRGSVDKAAFHRWRKLRLKSAFDRRQIEMKNLAAAHLGERQALYDHKEMRIAALRKSLREANRPVWAALFRKQKQERAELRKAKRTALSRVRYYLKNRSKSEQRMIAGAIKAFLAKTPFDRELSEKHEAERKALGKKTAQQLLHGIRQENEHHRKELEKFKAIQKGERDTLKDAHTKESQDLAREIAAGADEERYLDEMEKEGPPNAREDFMKAVKERIRKAKKRDERGKDLGRERE